ncbi:MAG: outer membrane lipoprotein carrier protein LolA [Bryobacterales bacterium]|nr:outer membrane lipoprotein carrier protein LolA [Bryobacterales bacterium]
MLQKMDAASAAVKGLKADFEQTSFEALVEDKSVEKGEVKVRRSNPDSSEVALHFTDPYVKDVLVTGTTAQIYKPQIKTVEEYDFAKSKDSVSQALSVGFAPSGTALREGYDAKLIGETKIDGKPVVHLELVPKNADSRRKFPKLEMWISTDNWQTLQQKLYQGSGGDYTLYSYSDIQVNPSLKDSDFKLNLPKGVKRVSPSK